MEAGESPAVASVLSSPRSGGSLAQKATSNKVLELAAFSQPKNESK